MAARLFFFRRDICPRPECALLDNLPIVSFSLSEKTVSQIRFFLFASEDMISVQGPPRPVPHKPGFYLNLFRENMAACVTALKRSHDLENYGFDGLR